MNEDWVQLIIVRKDLTMSAAKMAVQCCHASLGALHLVSGQLDDATRENWLYGSQTKIICQARSWSHMMKAVNLAEDMGLSDCDGYFLVHDECRTELTPENLDHTTTTCVGFSPMPRSMAQKLSRHYNLYTG